MNDLATENKIPRVCPWWLAYTWDNPLRRFWQDPVKMLGGYLKPGNTALDIGCGMGYFSIAMAKMVGESGNVIAVDVQDKMLEILKKRAAKAGVLPRIDVRKSQPGVIGVCGKADFALLFWMLHETPDRKDFLTQIYGILKPGGRLYLAEPTMHVSECEFWDSVNIAKNAGFKEVDEPKAARSRAVVFVK